MKFYAVKIGKNPGIYNTWSECELQVKGFSGAIYKSFLNKEDAEKFLNTSNTSKISNEPTEPYAFVDGSFNSTTNTYGYGGFLVENGNRHKIQGSGQKPELASMRNVAGEICGVVKAVKLALELGLKNLTIYYDYQGLEAWANRNWKTNKKYTAKYVNCIDFARKSMEINFIKVTAHTGIPGNEEADRLAKEAAGI